MELRLAWPVPRPLVSRDLAAKLLDELEGIYKCEHQILDCRSWCYLQSQQDSIDRLSCMFLDPVFLTLKADLLKITPLESWLKMYKLCKIIQA